MLRMMGLAGVHGLVDASGVKGGLLLVERFCERIRKGLFKDEDFHETPIKYKEEGAYLDHKEDYDDYKGDQEGIVRLILESKHHPCEQSVLKDAPYSP